MVNRIGRFQPVAETDEPTPEALAMVSGEMLTVKQVIARTGYSKAKLYQLMDCGKIPFIQDGKNCLRLIPEAGLVRYLASCLK